MKASLLYQRLEKEFISPEMTDDWAQYMESVSDFLSNNFKKRSMGLVCDFTNEIVKVYSAVFPSEKVMQTVLDKNEENIMLFVHHPSIWDIRNSPDVFQQMNRNLLEQFKKRKISIYNLHVPLDNYGNYSTGVSLLKVLEIIPKKPFARYFGALCGIFGKTSLNTTKELKEKLESVLGHKASLYDYGNDKIENHEVAVIAGGGNDFEMLAEIVKEGVNTFVTGITAKNSHSIKAHEFAEMNKINILGGTHYSTEKFACIAMCDYFKKVELSCEFINDEPVLEDL